MAANQLPVPQSPISDPKTGRITPEWYLFLNSFFQSSSSQSGTTVSDAQLLLEQQRSDSPAIDRLSQQFGELAALLQAQGNTSMSEDLVNRMAVFEMLLQEQSVFPILEKMQKRIDELESLLIAAQ